MAVVGRSRAPRLIDGWLGQARADRAQAGKSLSLEHFGDASVNLRTLLTEVLRPTRAFTLLRRVTRHQPAQNHREGGSGVVDKSGPGR
jgi:hypothetical protein